MSLGLTPINFNDLKGYAKNLLQIDVMIKVAEKVIAKIAGQHPEEIAHKLLGEVIKFFLNPENKGKTLDLSFTDQKGNLHKVSFINEKKIA